MFMDCILQLAAANYPAGSGGVCTSAHERRVNVVGKLQKLGVTKCARRRQDDRLLPHPVLQGGLEGRRDRTSFDCFNPSPLRACKYAASAQIS